MHWSRWGEGKCVKIMERGGDVLMSWWERGTC